MAIISAKNFSTKLASTLRAAKTQRANIQALIVFGLEHFVGEGEGDTGYLSRTLNGCVGVKSIPTRTIQKYIEEHANVKYSKAKDGTNVFKKVKGEVPHYVVPAVAWWEYDKGHQAVADLDIVKRLTSTHNAMVKAIEEDKVLAGQEEAILYAIDKIKDVLTGVQLAIALEEGKEEKEEEEQEAIQEAA